MKSYAQDSNNPLVLTFGLNSVDIRNNEGFEGAIRDYFGVDEDQNTSLKAISFSASRYIKNGFSVSLETSINKIEKGYYWKEGGVKLDHDFFAVGSRVNYDLNEIFGETGWFDPFVSLGANYTSIDSHGDYRVAMGYGFNTWFNKTVGLTFRSNYNHKFDKDGDDYFHHSLGFSFRFGRKDTDRDGVSDSKDSCPNEAGLPDFNGCPDTDGDGIVNTDDVCPNTAGIADFNGCPDSDGDGIKDANDKCPNAAGVERNGGCPDADFDGVVGTDDLCPNQAGPIENRGCPWPDTDGDGVWDKEDLCINEAGTLSNKGCPELKRKAKQLDDFTKTIYFDFEKSSLSSEATKHLDGVVLILKEFSDVNFRLLGYTDNIGKKSYNLRLSKKRINTVKKYLIANGIASKRIEVKGFGEENPIAPNKTSEGRKGNRRVEIIAVK